MSILINSFDPSSSALLDKSGNGVIITNGRNRNEQLVLYNSSLVCFQITFLDKTTDIMPPSWAKSFKKSGPIGIVTYKPIFTLPLTNASAQPISLCYGAVYESGEQVADLNMPLQYVYNVGNNLTVNTAQVVSNTGFPAATPFIFAEPTGDTSAIGAVNINNSGQATLGDLLNNGSLAIFGTYGGTNYSMTMVADQIQISNGVANTLALYGATAQVINGNVNGSVTIIEWMQGVVKCTLCIMKAYHSTVVANYTFLSAYSQMAMLRSGGISNGTDGGIQLISGGAAQGINVLTVLNANGGSTNSQTNFYGMSMGETISPFDTLRFNANIANHYGVLEIIGS